MNTFAEPKYYIEPLELSGFKEKTDTLLQYLQQDDLTNALLCIKEINRINDQSMFNIIGKITRGLHTAIADLNVSSQNSESDKNKTRAGLGYVISVTEKAAKTTLDMTEKNQEQLNALTDSFEQQNSLISRLQDDPADLPSLAQLNAMVGTNKAVVDNINRNVTEIVLAQNFQDITSQSLSKVMLIINDVENSLVSLTQYTNLLKQLSQFSEDTDSLDAENTAELRSNLEKIEISTESEHMDQDDVDNLLSSLGF